MAGQPFTLTRPSLLAETLGYWVFWISFTSQEGVARGQVLKEAMRAAAVEALPDSLSPRQGYYTLTSTCLSRFFSFDREADTGEDQL